MSSKFQVSSFKFKIILETLDLELETKEWELNYAKGSYK